MKRTSINIPEPTLNWLQLTAEHLGISVGELVRRILDRYRESDPMMRRPLT